MSEIQIGKFDIFATYSYAKAKLDGMEDRQAKEYGYVIAVMGARAKSGHGRGGGYSDVKKAAEKKKKKTITPEMYERQIEGKLGDFYKECFLPVIAALVEQGISYKRVKELVGIPSSWGAKISAQQFMQNSQ